MECPYKKKNPDGTIVDPKAKIVVKPKEVAFPKIEINYSELSCSRIHNDSVGLKMATTGEEFKHLTQEQWNQDEAGRDDKNKEAADLSYKAIQYEYTKYERAGTVVADGNGGFETLHLFKPTREYLEKSYKRE